MAGVILALGLCRFCHGERDLATRQVVALRDAIICYQNETGQLPAQSNWVYALTVPGTVPGDSSRKGLVYVVGAGGSFPFIDPWSNSIYYETNIANFIVGSLGSDGRKGTRDDIVAKGTTH